MRSLRRRYLVASAGVIGALLITVVLAYRHVARITEDNTQALRLAARVTATLDRVPDALRHADHALQDLLAQPMRYEDSPLARHLRTARDEVSELAADPALAEVNWHHQLVALQERLDTLTDAAERLLALYPQPGWLYPALPLIAGTMFDANNGLDTALEAAVTEARGARASPEQRALYDELVILRGLWRRLMLDFRASMIRFAGLPTEPLPDDDAVRELYATIQDRLARLEARPALWQDLFETAELIPTLRPLAAAWYRDYHRVRELQASGRWRGDVQYTTAIIRPLQRDLNQRVLALEQAVSAWATANTARVATAATDINHLLWVLAALALASLLLNYLILDRGLLRPVAEVSEALSAHADGGRDVALPAGRHREIARLVTAFEDMQAQIRQRQQDLEHQAMHDVLTRLPNRALLRDRLEQGLAARERQGDELGLLLLDLDRFKEINDSLGHHAGDQVLKEVARRLSALVRDSDTVARLGGDEFAVVLPGLDRAAAAELAQRIAGTLERPYQLDGQPLHLGASIGVVVAPQDGTDPPTLLRRADNAMYAAKRSGRNHAFYDPEADRAASQGLRLAHRLREALAGGPGLSLRYVPRLSLQEDRIAGVAAVVYWQEPAGEALAPARLLHVAAHAGLLPRLTRWALDRALRDCAQCRRQGLELPVAVRLPARDLAEPGLADLVRTLLDQHGLPATRLTLEIAETAIMAEPGRAGEQLAELAAMGVRLALDDFGTGRSSLAYLNQLPLHALKIDPSLVRGMAGDKGDGLIVRSIIELGHDLGLQVVAAGVEHAETLAQLRRLGCDAAQGNQISEPVPLDELASRLHEQQRGSDNG